MCCHFRKKECCAHAFQSCSDIQVHFQTTTFNLYNMHFSFQKFQQIISNIITVLKIFIYVSILILSMITFIGKILFTHWLSVYRAAGSCEKILSWRRSDGFPSPSSQPQQTTQQPGSELVCSQWSDLPVDSAFRYACISNTVCLEHCDLLLLFFNGWKNNSCTDGKLCCFFSPPVTALCVSLLLLEHL